MNLGALLDGYAMVAPADDRTVSGVAMDHRQVARDSLFLACAGGRGHGARWVPAALERGARAIAWEPASGVAAPPVPPDVPALAVEHLRARAGAIAARFFGDPSRSLDVVGVTGTNGKTSVTHLVAHGLAALGRRCDLIGTLGYGATNALAGGQHTTPDAVTVQRLLAGMRDAGAVAVAVEVSSHALDQARVDSVRFRVAVFTNLTRDHLDYHTDLADYGRAKRRLFELAATEAAVLCVDDAYGRELLAALAGPRVTAVGATASALASRFVEVEDVEYHARGLRLHARTHAGPMRIDSVLLGHFNATNLALAAAVLLELGISPTDAARALAAAPTVPGRMEAFGGGDAPLVVVDYAHTPDALEQVLRAAREHATGRVACVFGCGGERDRGKRPLMAAVAAAWADETLVTDDNPRGEDGDAIVAEVVDGFPAAARWRVQRDRARAIHDAIASAASGDVVVVAGKGHEDYQLVGAEVRAHSDRATVVRILAGRLS